MASVSNRAEKGNNSLFTRNATTGLSAYASVVVAYANDFSKKVFTVMPLDTW